MTTRSLLHATLASTALLLLGAVLQDPVAVAASLVSMVVAGVWLVIRLDDTSKPVHVLLNQDRAAPELELVAEDR